MPKTYSRALCWLRRDLRLGDNTALAAATSEAHEVAVAFVFDPNILVALADRDDRRVTFIHRSLREVDSQLRAKGSGLFVVQGDPRFEMPALAERLGAEAIYAARDFEPYAIERDLAVRSAFAGDFYSPVDHVIQPADTIVNREGLPFRVFTPYARAWRESLNVDMVAGRIPNLDRLIQTSPPSMPTLQELGFEEAELWLAPGEAAARARLDSFLPKLAFYGKERDLPATEGTSGLSVHLRFGTLSIREAWRAAQTAPAEDRRTWENELIWREFYSMILACFPEVAAGPFQSQYSTLNWPGRKEDFDAWCRGQTGFPIVDAAMRCLNATGWMHNRLRMIAASFLTKDLLCDYRLGEAYFARRLLDFELASNNGGWQWAASVGTDAQPYFRVFNPELQSRKFDPQGGFIRRWCPELAMFNDSAIHAPSKASPSEQEKARCIVGTAYPAPIVDHATQRDLAIRLFKAAR